MAAINKPDNPNPENSADVEARALLRNHVARGIKSQAPRTSPGSQVTKARQVTGTQVSGGGRITGGRG